MHHPLDYSLKEAVMTSASADDTPWLTRPPLQESRFHQEEMSSSWRRMQALCRTHTSRLVKTKRKR